VEVDPALWVFAEHKMDGTPAMPGTGIVELIRAAHQEVTGNATADIRDLMFPSLLAAKPGVEARIELRRAVDGGYTVSVTGGMPSRPAEQFARGRVYAVEEAPALHHDLTAIATGSWRDSTPDFNARIGPMEFGDRWDAIRSRRSSDDLDFLDLSLPERFVGDLDHFGVHPALLDVAGAMGMSRPGDELYLPFGYDRIIVRRSVPAVCHSVIRHLDDTRGELTRVDLTIIAMDGEEILVARGYSLLRVSGNKTPDAVSELAAAARMGSPGRSSAAGSPVIALIRESNADSSVSSAEGGEALRVILSDSHGPQVILSPGGISERVRRAGRITRAVLVERLASAAAGEGATRDIATPYVPPETEAELTIAELWRDSIGVDQVGIDDDFLDLGGDSLLAVQLVGRLSQRFKTDVSVAQLFDNRTVRALAASIVQETGT
jgi:acyl carrier protein